MAHPLDKWEPSPEDVIHIQSKALDEKAQTVYRLERENEDLRTINEDLRTINAQLLTACKAADLYLDWGWGKLGPKAPPPEYPGKLLRSAIAKAEEEQ